MKNTYVRLRQRSNLINDLFNLIQIVSITRVYFEEKKKELHFDQLIDSTEKQK